MVKTLLDIFLGRWFKVCLYLLVGLVLFSLLSFYVLNLHLNTTASLPRGLYAETKNSIIKHEDLVYFCLNADNWASLAQKRDYVAAVDSSCPLGLKPLLKTVKGLPGDKISFTPEGLIAVNGHSIENSKYKNLDRDGLPMPPSDLKPGLIPPSFALLLSENHTGSFDSRYFGLVPLALLTKVEAFFTEGNF